MCDKQTYRFRRGFRTLSLNNILFSLYISKDPYSLDNEPLTASKPKDLCGYAISSRGNQMMDCLVTRADECTTFVRS